MLPVKKPRIPTGLTSSESSDEEEATTSSKLGYSHHCKPHFPHIIPKGSMQPLTLSDVATKPVIQVPGTINQYLRDYQRDGILFLYKHYRVNEGAILADDMGLGKTVQVIAFIAAILRKTGTKTDILNQVPQFIRKLSENLSFFDDDGIVCKEKRKPFLIIGPTTMLGNWLDELETWGYFTVGKFYKDNKEKTVSDLEKNKLEVVVTTYETCRNHLHTINRFAWEAVFADEAHKIKIQNTEITKALKKLNCVRRYGLTGTPLQNNLKELWCILDWANPGCLGDLLSFENNICKVIDLGQRQESTKRELASARIAQEKLARIKSKWMIRRTKKLIADQLPKREELIVYCKCTELQADIYKTIMSQPDMKLILEQGEPCSCGRDATKGRCCFKKSEDGRSVRALTLTYMHLLLKAANHIALLLPVNIEADSQKKYAQKICEQVFLNHPQYLEQTRESAFRTLSDPKFCGKMKLLTGLLTVFKKKKSKVLLFSLSTRLLDIIEQYVISKGYEYRRLDGNTPNGKRTQFVKEFNTDPYIFLFLMSTKAGGVGLNLTGANVVIIFDPNWNPTHDLQAQDRVYRLGQTRDVKIYRLICSGTIEENIYLRQIYKQQKAEIAIEGENAKRYFNDGELFGVANMFHMRDSERCLTEDIFKRNRKVEEGLKAYRIEQYVPCINEKEKDRDCASNEESNCSDNYSSSQVSQEEVKAKGEPHRRKFTYSKKLAFDKSVNENHSEPSTSKFGTNTHHEARDKTANLELDEIDEIFQSYSSAPYTAISEKSSSCMKKRQNFENEDIDNRDVNYCSESNDSQGTVDYSFSDEATDRLQDKKRKQSTTSISFQKTKICKKRFKKCLRRSPGITQVTPYYESVSDVLDMCDVVHTHENKKVIGGSRAENHMSKCAIEDVFVNNISSQLPAVDCQPYYSSSGESDDLGNLPSKSSHLKNSENSDKSNVDEMTPKKNAQVKKDMRHNSWSQTVGNRTVLVGQTPKAIRRQQFIAIAAFLDVKPQVLAKQIIYSHPHQRYQMLKAFYASQDADFLPVMQHMKKQFTAEDAGGKEHHASNKINVKETKGKVKEKKYKKHILKECKHGKKMKRNRTALNFTSTVSSSTGKNLRKSECSYDSETDNCAGEEDYISGQVKNNKGKCRKKKASVLSRDSADLRLLLQQPTLASYSSEEESVQSTSNHFSTHFSTSKKATTEVDKFLDDLLF